jgi:iron complex transport system substrate-binding protein
MNISRLFLFHILLILNLLVPISIASARVPDRIISLAPNITEILFAMDMGNKIVGVTSFCDYPDEAKRKTKVGGMSNPSLEAVVSLRPDIVVMTTDGNPKEFEERLHSLGIKTYVFRARKLSELPGGIREMGTALGVKQKADELAWKIESAMNRFAITHHSLPITAHPLPKEKVLFIIWPEPLIVAGPGTEIDDTITLLGGDNIASKAKTSYPRYSLEKIIRQSPDVIFIGRGHRDMKEMSKGLLEKIASVPAVKNGHVFFLSDSLYRLGPRVVSGIGEMAACLK